MNDRWWDLSRATGIVATVLAVAALMMGLFFSARNTGERRRPAWWLDLHNWLGGLTLIFTIAHVVIAYLDSDTGLSLASLFVPGVASSQRLAVAWGVIATYLFATTVLSSWPRKRFARRTWRIVHLGSVLGVALALVHAYQMGTDGTERAFRIGMLLRDRDLHAVHPAGRGPRPTPRRGPRRLRFTGGTQATPTSARASSG